MEFMEYFFENLQMLLICLSAQIPLCKEDFSGIMTHLHDGSPCSLAQYSVSIFICITYLPKNHPYLIIIATYNLRGIRAEMETSLLPEDLYSFITANGFL